MERMGEPGSQPYSRATAVLKNRRQSQAIRHRIASASNPKEGLRRLWETGLPPKRWLEVNTPVKPDGTIIFTPAVSACYGALERVFRRN